MRNAGDELVRREPRREIDGLSVDRTRHELGCDGDAVVALRAFVEPADIGIRQQVSARSDVGEVFR
ncbi:hypothetical protein SDC9_182977 [bioreactor metagenome]|uniref:Uncharacterized protein n=1 Tax=bioreactor metagenome TaxID=1076179 RepID=A0A645HBH6_9ZZZZ